ncbi:MAG: PEGA domain-containing protein [Candidatus Dojkabacteria bacterium]|jgi:hypothetical protein|nr:PEGA domain-containing protein [Candidatus Dojkabacteria bacterium]
MKKWKIALIITSIVVLISLLLFFLPPENLFKHIPILKSFYQNTTLEISVPYGKASVKIDGKEYGETPLNIQNLVAGEYSVQLERISEDSSYYKPQTFKVLLTKNSTSRINIEIGPDSNIYGTVLYYEEQRSFDSNKGKLTISSNAPNTKVYMNQEFLKSAPITNLDVNGGEYDISLEAPNYEGIKLPIVVREGYTLHIKGYLLPIPVIFESSQTDE